MPIPYSSLTENNSLLFILPHSRRGGITPSSIHFSNPYPHAESFHPVDTARSRRGISFLFYSVSLHLSLDETLFFCITEWYRTLVLCVAEWYETLVFCVQMNPVVPKSPYGCCYVCPGLGLNCMHNLGVEEMPNWLDKHSEERNLTKI